MDSEGLGPHLVFDQGNMRVSVITTVKDEFPWIGYSIMSALPYVHEFIYTVADNSKDGTIELLDYLSQKHKKVRFYVSDKYSFKPQRTADYNQAFNDAINVMTGDVAYFLHPDMIVTKWGELKEGPLAWYTHVTSYAGDLTTQIVKGRASRWKNMHRNKFGLVYYGDYGSQNEDFYHRDITGTAYKHYGEEFDKYPFEVADSGIHVNHYCEVKAYARRLEKMKICLKTQNPHFSDERIDELATQHPRVTLEPSNREFGNFEFKKTEAPVPEVFAKYKDEFESVRLTHV